MRLGWCSPARRDRQDPVGGRGLGAGVGVGRTTAWVQATVSASAIPFGAFAHLLPVDLDQAGPVNLLRMAGDAVASRSADDRLVLGVDDAHRLDASSAALLVHLVSSGSCFVVLTVRSQEPSPDTIVSLWKDGPLERVELQTLSEEDVADLLLAVLGGPVDGATRRRLWEASRGNPLYLHELVDGGIDGAILTAEHGVWRWRAPTMATPRITELVESRLTDLSPAQRKLLEIVALAEPLEAALLAALSERADRERLERRGLLETLTSERRRSVGLSHPLYADAIRATTPPSTVQGIFHQLAELLDSSGARRSGDLLRLATWRLDGGDADGALFLAAAERAVALLDHALAARLAQAAADGGGGFEARYLLATAAIGMGDGGRAEQILDALADEAQNDDQRVRAAIRRADNLFWRLGRGDEGCAVLEHALGVVEDRAGGVQLLVSLAGLQLFGGATEASLRTIDEALGRPGGDEPLTIQAAVPAYSWGSILRGRFQEALDATVRWAPVASLFMGGAVEFTPVFVSANRGAVALMDGRLADSESAASEAFEESLTPGKSTFRGFFGFWLGWARRVRGFPRSAAAVLVEAEALLREVDLYRHRTACLGELAHSYALIDEVGAATAALSAADEARVPSFVMDHSYLMGAKAWLAFAARRTFTGSPARPAMGRRLQVVWADGVRSVRLARSCPPRRPRCGRRAVECDRPRRRWRAAPDVCHPCHGARIRRRGRARPGGDGVRADGRAALRSGGGRRSGRSVPPAGSHR